MLRKKNINREEFSDFISLLSMRKDYQPSKKQLEYLFAIYSLLKKKMEKQNFQDFEIDHIKSILKKIKKDSFENILISSQPILYDIVQNNQLLFSSQTIFEKKDVSFDFIHPKSGQNLLMVFLSEYAHSIDLKKILDFK